MSQNSHPQIQQFDRRLPLVGRRKEYESLVDSISSSGITFITAPPQTGKTRLVQELIYNLFNDERSDLIWGYAEGYGDSRGDIALRAADSLYDNFFNQRNWKQEAIQHLERLKENPIEKIGHLTSSIIQAFGDSQIVPGSKLVSDALSTLASQKTNQIPLAQPLDSTKMHELCQLVEDACKSHIILVIDAYEQTGNQKPLQDLLTQYAKQHYNWPSIHFIVTLRSPANHSKKGEVDAANVAKIIQKQSERCQTLELNNIKIDDYPAQKRELGTTLINKVPSINLENVELYIKESRGFPGIWHRWIEKECKNEKELTTCIDNAHSEKYEELDLFLDKMDGTEKSIICAITIFPEMVEEDQWTIYKNWILEKNPESILDNLKNTGILQNIAPPQFGLTQRYEYARGKLFDSYRLYVQESIKSISNLLIKTLINRMEDIKRIDSSIQILANIYTIIKEYKIESDHHLLFDISKHYSERSIIDQEKLKRIKKEIIQEKSEKVAYACSVILMSFLRSNYNYENKESYYILTEILYEILGKKKSNVSKKRDYAITLNEVFDEAIKDGYFNIALTAKNNLEKLHNENSNDNVIRGILISHTVSRFKMANTMKNITEEKKELLILKDLYKTYPKEEETILGYAIGLSMTLTGENSDSRIQKIRTIERLYKKSEKDIHILKILLKTAEDSIKQARNKKDLNLCEATETILNKLHTERADDQLIRDLLGLTLIAKTKIKLGNVTIGNRTRNNDI